MSQRNFALIGVDGGATEVKAHAVACDDSVNPARYTLLPQCASRIYERLPGFDPLPASEQIDHLRRADIPPSPLEHEQALIWVQAAAECIVEVARACGYRTVVVGIGMPGLKTGDGRGIAVINNGPRNFDYLEILSHEVEAAGIEWASPVVRLGSDADYCGLGEQHAADGLFNDVQSAYYLGCGTGIADALKLNGCLVAFDDIKEWMLKTWQIPSALGPTFEKLVSAKALNHIYAQLQPGAGSADCPCFPEQGALRGDSIALTWMNAAAMLLAELIFERLSTIKTGRAASTSRGQAYAELDPEHPYRGLLLDRIVIGQRIGQVYGDPQTQPFFASRLESCLAQFITQSGDAEMASTYLLGGGLAPGFVRASFLRSAPALGAAVAAAKAMST